MFIDLFELCKKNTRNVIFIKILSQDFLDVKLIKNFYLLKLPLYLSVGLSSSKQIKVVLNALKKKVFKENTILLHTSFDKDTNKKFNMFIPLTNNKNIKSKIKNYTAKFMGHHAQEPLLG